MTIGEALQAKAQTQQKTRDKNIEGKRTPRNRPNHQELPMTTQAETISAAEKTNAKPAKKDAELEQLGQALGEGFNRLDNSMTQAAARIEEAVSEVRPAFKIQAELGAAMTGAGAGCVVGAVIGTVASMQPTADGVLPGRLERAEIIATSMGVFTLAGAGLGATVAKLVGGVREGGAALARRRARKAAESG